MLKRIMYLPVVVLFLIGAMGVCIDTAYAQSFLFECREADTIHSYTTSQSRWSTLSSTQDDLRRYRDNGRAIANGLGKCVKIEISEYQTPNKCLTIKSGDPRFGKILTPVRSLLRSGKGMIGGPPYGVLAEYQIRFIVSSDVSYEAKYSPKTSYFEILRKTRVRSNGKKAPVKIVEDLSAVVHKCPASFVKQMRAVLK